MLSCASKPMGILSVDVEDYFHVEAFADHVDRNRWHEYPTRVDENTAKILDLFDACSVQATFFVLGWVAERYPGIIHEIARRGHEIGCHSYWHRRVFELTPDEFREDTDRAKRTIEDAAGMPVHGYRAPSFSVVKKSWWALEILAECGFRYDSSIFPVRHDLYGFPDASRFPFRVDTPAGALVEFPMTTFRYLGSPNLPVGGGGYLRIFPLWLTKFGVQRAFAENVPLIVYTHPWELDTDQPRIQGRLTSRLRHYTNLGKTAARLRSVMAMARFSSFRDSGMVEAVLQGR